MIVKRGFILETVLAAVPHDVLAIVAPDRMSIIGGEGGHPAHVSTVRLNCVDVEVLILLASEKNAPAVRRSVWKIIRTVRENSHRMILQIQNP